MDSGRFCLDYVTVGKLNRGVVRHSDSRVLIYLGICRRPALTTCSVPQGPRTPDECNLGYRIRRPRFRLGTPDIVVIHAGRPQSVRARCARTAARSIIQPRRRLARNPHRLESRAPARELRPPAHPGARRPSWLSLTESALMALGPDLALGPGGRPSHAIHQDARRIFRCRL